MKLFANKKIFKKIVIMLVTIMMITTLMPLHQISAATDEETGGDLFRPIMQLFAAIGDLAMRRFAIDIYRRWKYKSRRGTRIPHG